MFQFGLEVKRVLLVTSGISTSSWQSNIPSLIDQRGSGLPFSPVLIAANTRSLSSIPHQQITTPAIIMTLILMIVCSLKNGCLLVISLTCFLTENFNIKIMTCSISMYDWFIFIKQVKTYLILNIYLYI